MAAPSLQLFSSAFSCRPAFLNHSLRRREASFDSLTISLMLTAGLLHASWHSLVKSGENGLVILAGMGAVAGVCAAATVPFVAFPSPELWPVLLLSIGLHILYKSAWRTLMHAANSDRRFRFRAGWCRCLPPLLHLCRRAGAFAKPVCRDCARQLRIVASRAG